MAEVLKLIVTAVLVAIFGALARTYPRSVLMPAFLACAGLALLLWWRDLFGDKYWGIASTFLVCIIAVIVVGPVWWFVVLPRVTREAKAEITAPVSDGTPPAPSPSGDVSGPTGRPETDSTPAPMSPRAEPSSTLPVEAPAPSASSPKRPSNAVIVSVPPGGEPTVSVPRSAPNIRLAIGDVVVVDERAVVRIHPVSGEQTTIASGGLLRSPRGLTLRPDGQILLTDPGAFGGTGAVFLVDPISGRQSTISAGGTLAGHPYGIVLEEDGNILITNANAGNIVRVDPSTGNQTILSSRGSLREPKGIAIGPNGDLFIADEKGQILQIDRSTGEQTVISSGELLQSPSALLQTTKGDLLVADADASAGNGAIIRVDINKGTQALLASGGGFMNPYGLALTSGGDLLVVEHSGMGGSGGIIRIDADQGTQKPITAAPPLRGPRAIAIVSDKR